VRSFGTRRAGLDPRSENRKTWAMEEIFRLAGREADLIVFCPTEKWRLNCIDYILRSGGQCKDVTKFLMTVGETLRSSDSDGQEDGKFGRSKMSA